MSVEAIGAIFTGLASVIVALGALLATRGRKTGEDSRLMKFDLEMLQKKYRAAMRHIFSLETAMEGAGKPVPNRPMELDPNWDGQEKAKS